MLFSDLYGEVLANGFPSTYTLRVKRWVNWAQHDILSRYEWACREATTTFNTAGATQTYTIVGASPVIPDFAGQIQWSVDISSNSVAFLPMQEVDQVVFERVNQIPTSGTPAIYTLVGGAAATTSGAVKAGGTQEVWFFPTPDDAYPIRVRYYRSADSVEMTADTDVPLIPARLQPAIVMLATAIGHEFENNPDQGAPLRNAAERLIGEAVQAEPRARRSSGNVLDDAPKPAYPPAPPQTQAAA